MGKASDELVVAGCMLARRENVVFYMHQSFAAADTAEIERLAPGRLPVQHLDEMGVLGSDLSLVHMIRCEQAEIPLLAASGTHVVHCPAASVRWGMGASRVGLFPEMLDAEVNVSLGSDSGNYSDFLDVGRQAYLAATIHREARGSTPIISAQQAVEMATINGARALGIADTVGSIEVGKRADITVHSSLRPEWHPMHDAAASLIYSAQSHSVRDVVVDGEVVLQQGRFTRLDEGLALSAIDRFARDLYRRMGLSIERPWPILETWS
jgi:cytosine/adenosine deaminase-related metal-dependent hydrolase